MSDEIMTVENTDIASTDHAPVSFVASFDTTTPAGKVKAYNAAMGADESIRDNIGEQINMVDYLIENIEVVDEFTGVLENRAHVVIFADDKRTFEGQSIGLVQSLKRLAQICPVSPETPVAVEFIERRMKRGVMYQLRML